MMRRYIPWLLLAGDLLALFFFVYVGQRDHDTLDPLQPWRGLLVTTLVLVVPWLGSALILGAFSREAAARPAALLGRSLTAWLVAAPLALLLRAYLLGRAVIPTAFLAATLGFGGAFLLGWRLVFVVACKIYKGRR